MTFRTFLHLALGALAVVGLAACSDEEPPGWLEDLAVDAAVATSVPPATASPPTTETPLGRDTAALDLEQGACLVDVPFLDGEPVEVTELLTVHCREPHQAEVYDVVQLPQQRNTPFPGAPLARQARNQCQTRFEAFVGVPWTSSELEFATLRPTAESWAEGDRAIVCTLFRPDGKDLEGSARNSKL